MLKTAGAELTKDWEDIFNGTEDKRITNGLSRFARWASLRDLSPREIDRSAFERFFSELEAQTLVRNLSFQKRNVPRLWNRLCAAFPKLRLTVAEIPPKQNGSTRMPWGDLPKSLRKETEAYLTWCTVPDPLDDDARVRALAPATLKLRRQHIHVAAAAACECGGKPARLNSLAKLVEPDTFRAILRHQWKKNGGKTSIRLLGLANDLIAMASEWVEVSADQLAALKKLRSKLGALPHGLTEKNRSLLRRLEDPHLLGRLLNLPDKMWKRARRNPPPPPYWFVDLQTALAVDILLHVPLRIEDLSSLKFDEHIHWPQGKRKPALITVRQSKIKDSDPLECELPPYLSDRLYSFRNEIAPKVIGRRPEFLFVSADGTRRGLVTLRVAIQRAVLRNVGMKISPHQFRHLAGKLHLDAYPNAHESVRQFLGHADIKTTTRFYAGPNTRRAGKAHADLIGKLREPSPKPRNRNRSSDEWRTE